ncbi:MAG: hypothetical protein NTW21_20500 [Verrucomicrobia bacterium]|nr:hypothetical protein [Verrucomicrobiota bacterium]
MIFVVAIDPQSILTLIERGEVGEELLLGIFEALLQNCLLAETSVTWRMGGELKDTVSYIKDPDIKKRVSAVMETFANPSKSRFVSVIDGYESDWDTSLSEIVANQGDNAELDAAICETPKHGGVLEFISALRFNSSNFARSRSRSACALIYAPGAKFAHGLLKEAFGRLVRHAEAIEIYDRQIGKDFGANYYEAIPHWCKFFKGFDRKLEIVVHTTDAQAHGVKLRFQAELADSKVTIKVVGHLETEQPHDRFLRACQFTIDIGRGIDLFDKDGACRDVKIGISNHGEFTKQWRHLS